MFHFIKEELILCVFVNLDDDSYILVLKMWKCRVLKTQRSPQLHKTQCIFVFAGCLCLISVDTGVNRIYTYLFTSLLTQSVITVLLHFARHAFKQTNNICLVAIPMTVDTVSHMI